MTEVPGLPRAEAFFLKSAVGQRFCLFHPPAGVCCGAVLYVHPFAEEMNRSRRMAVLQARKLAVLGFGVLAIDLYGCGDSSGDFGDARWEAWKDDLALGAHWLHERLKQPVTLWGLRLGALLALAYARDAARAPAALMLWQPVRSGSNFMTQFLRLRLAGALLDDGERIDTSTLRRALGTGEVVEIAGYDLAPALANAIDTLDPLESMLPPCPVHWFELLGSADAAVPAGVTRTHAEWRRKGADVQLHAVAGPAFWATPEITTSPELLIATSTALRTDGHGL